MDKDGADDEFLFRQDVVALSPSQLSRRLFPPRWAPGLLRRSPQLVSFDIFGFAFDSALLHPRDLHRLVAGTLEQRIDQPIANYPDIRSRAETEAREAARAAGRTAIATPDISDRLGPMLGEALGGDTDPTIAREAMRAELDFHQRTVRANPDALQIYRQALAAEIGVAFVADSYLPRDLVAQMLHRAGYGRGLVLVSSHEGRTKGSGELFATLANRARIDPPRITHIGPDPVADVERPAEAGITGILAASMRTQVVDRIELGVVEPTGVDSLALALAADHLAESRLTIGPDNIGFYATGPLLAGFCGWAAALADRLDGRPLLCTGPSARLLREVTLTLRPDLPPARVQAVPSAGGRGADRSELRAAMDRIPTELRSRVTAIDLGWGAEPTSRWLVDELRAIGIEADVHHTSLAPPPIGGSTGPDRSTWAFDGGDDDPLALLRQRSGPVLEALVPGDHALRSGTLDGTLPGLAQGAVGFAEEFRQWLRLDAGGASAALTEPALRVALAPLRAETELLSPHVPDWPAGDDRGPLRFADDSLEPGRFRLGRRRTVSPGGPPG